MHLGYCRIHEIDALDDLAPGILGDAGDSIGRGITITPAGCWLAPDWMASINGYASLKLDGERWLGHRLLYVLFMPPHLNSRELDHLGCESPRCIRPDHLEPVTAKENKRRRDIRSADPSPDWLARDAIRAHISIPLMLWAAQYGLPLSRRDAIQDGALTVVRQ